MFLGPLGTLHQLRCVACMTCQIGQGTQNQRYWYGAAVLPAPSEAAAAVVNQPHTLQVSVT